MDSIKLLALNENEPHERELGHVTIRLFALDVKEKTIGVSEVEKLGLPP